MLRDKLVPDLLDLLDLPHTNASKAKGRQVLRAILQSITAALHRGESVSVRGFGVFQVVTRKRNNGHLIAWSDGFGKPKFKSSPSPHEVKYVVFKPSTSLEAWVNLQGGFALTDRQRLATRYWKLPNGNQYSTT